jgi:hypothetical protein
LLEEVGMPGKSRTPLRVKEDAQVKIGDVWTKITVWIRSDRLKEHLEGRTTRKPNRKPTSGRSGK